MSNLFINNKASCSCKLTSMSKKPFQTVFTQCTLCHISGNYFLNSVFHFSTIFIAHTRYIFITQWKISPSITWHAWWSIEAQLAVTLELAPSSSYLRATLFHEFHVRALCATRGEYVVLPQLWCPSHKEKVSERGNYVYHEQRQGGLVQNHSWHVETFSRMHITRLLEVRCGISRIQIRHVVSRILPLVNVVQNLLAQLFLSTLFLHRGSLS